MTALDPTPVLPARREALDRLDELRERVADFLDRPSAERFNAMTSNLQGFVQFEADEVLTDDGLVDVGLERLDDVAAGHDLLTARVNVMSWAVPGTADAQNAAHQLRHELLAQAERYQSLRLPRGTIINGS